MALAELIQGDFVLDKSIIEGNTINQWNILPYFELLQHCQKDRKWYRLRAVAFLFGRKPLKSISHCAMGRLRNIL